jgi:hypothetical protein
VCALQVAGLAKTLQEKKDELEAKGQEAVAQARVVEDRASRLTAASSPPPPVIDVQKVAVNVSEQKRAPVIQERPPTAQVANSTDTSTPAG